MRRQRRGEEKRAVTKPAAILLVFVTSFALRSRVVRIEVRSRADLIDGNRFGAAGPYDKLSGLIYLRGRSHQPREYDHHRHREGPEKRARPRGVLVGLLSDQAQVDRARQRTVLYEVSNRGGKGMLAFTITRRAASIRRRQRRWATDS